VCFLRSEANVIVLSLMTGLDPIEYVVENLSVDRFGRPTSSYGHCDYASAIAFMITLAVINIGTLLFALYQAWQARSLSTEFAESR
jgi:type VI protein secretion system component VasK